MGSHGKHLHFKVSGAVIYRAATDSKEFPSFQHDIDLGEIPTHGQGPAQGTEADARTYVLTQINLGQGDKILDITWNNYSKK